MGAIDTDNFLKITSLFWQYPVITEKSFYEQNKINESFLGLPWATILDKRVNLNELIRFILTHLKNKPEYTCCQHISFRKLIPLFKVLKIKTLYSPHKIKGEDYINDIKILPCPLYAVNIEDSERNADFLNKDFMNIERPYIYSFLGAYQKDYMSDIRLKIFQMKKNDSSIIVNTGDWHFNKVVYSTSQNNNGELNQDSKHQDKTKKYNDILLKSKYSLCPSGTGPNSIRFWESLACGSIPILLSDKMELPENSLWEKSIICVSENKLSLVPEILSEISEEEEHIRRNNCLKIYKYFKNNYKNQDLDDNSIIPKVLFTSYKIDSNNTLVQKILLKWQNLNPKYSIKYFSDKDVYEFFKGTQYFDTFSKMKNGVAIADFFRINYIQKYGGYWFDFDLEPIKVELPNYGKIHLFDSGYKNISYMFIGGAPNQKLFEEIIIKVNNNIIDNLKIKKQHVLEITGPRIIQSIIMPKLNKSNLDDGILEAGKNPTTFLENSDYEFVYQRISFINTKTEEYKLLQIQNNQKPYQCYNYI